jgi:hypothetical protein
MLATLLIGLATVHPWLVVFLFPSTVLVAAIVTLAILSAILSPDRDNRVRLK